MNFRQYEVVRELGQGQFGDVYLAVGEVPGRNGAPARRRTVAIKTLRRQQDVESLRFLRQEFALLDQVKHRAIVRVFEFLEEERAVVMEYVHGVPLRTVLEDCHKAREQVFTEAAIEIGCEVADALYQAWTSPADNGDRLRLVHRDLKPENIMLTPEGELRVLDFGLARVDNAEFARDDARRVRGTPLYMAPEQARGEDIDHRTDLFALGLILYELLMGRPAYRVPTDAPDPIKAAFAAIESGALSDECRELEAKLPGMGPVVARLLQSNPRNRYPNGQDLLVDLRRQLYRDRGSYIKEFCSFYFGSLHPLAAPPNPDAPPGGRVSTEKRKSMEERLAESLVDDTGEPGPRAPMPVRRAARPTPPAASPPPPPAPPPPMAPPVAAAPRGAGPPKITPRSASAARPAPVPEPDDLPPSVKGKSPSGPARPLTPTTPRAPVGARSPQEAGMLSMVPLGNEDEAEAAADPSATAFFAIPAPKSERPKTPSMATPAPSSSPGFTPPSPGARPAMPSMAGGGGGGGGGFTPPAHQGPASIGMGQPSGPQSIGMGAGGIQGPVANSGGGTPFGVSGPVPTQGSSVESRMQSTRVFALVIVAFGILCVAVLLAGVGIWWKLSQEEKPPETVAVVEAPKPATTKPAAPRDTGAQQAPKVTTAKPKPSGGTSTKPAGSTEPPKPRAGPTAPVSVTFSGASIPGSVEISCDGGFRERKSVSGGSAVVSGVPNGVNCTLYPKGGIVASSAPVRGGGSYTCTITGTTTSCR